jgi:hypothetical protein
MPRESDHNTRKERKIVDFLKELTDLNSQHEDTKAS